ncbi:hypothetical protein ABZV67_31310 [Streptomyces sp. NPDC005065]|uniref:hypothetical protein n=1 Tax=unclassified Streptomyces TaxID=2593676 RepID=UPI0033A59054
MEGHDGAQVAGRRLLQEATVRIAKADVVPTDANLLPAYDSSAELANHVLVGIHPDQHFALCGAPHTSELSGTE